MGALPYLKKYPSNTIKALTKFMNKQTIKIIQTQEGNFSFFIIQNTIIPKLRIIPISGTMHDSKVVATIAKDLYVF